MTAISTRAPIGSDEISTVARRRPVADVAAVDLVQLREVTEVDEVDRRVEHLLEVAPRSLENRLQVLAHLQGLLLDRVPDDRVVPGTKRHLSGHEDEVSETDRLRVRRALEGRGSVLRANDR